MSPEVQMQPAHLCHLPLLVPALLMMRPQACIYCFLSVPSDSRIRLKTPGTSVSSLGPWSACGWLKPLSFLIGLCPGWGFPTLCLHHCILGSKSADFTHPVGPSLLALPHGGAMVRGRRPALCTPTPLDPPPQPPGRTLGSHLSPRSPHSPARSPCVCLHLPAPLPQGWVSGSTIPPTRAAVLAPRRGHSLSVQQGSSR